MGSGDAAICVGVFTTFVSSFLTHLPAVLRCHGLPALLACGGGRDGGGGDCVLGGEDTPDPSAGRIQLASPRCVLEDGDPPFRCRGGC